METSSTSSSNTSDRAPIIFDPRVNGIQVPDTADALMANISDNPELFHQTFSLMTTALEDARSQYGHYRMNVQELQTSLREGFVDVCLE
ncbi:MAG: hypothetical protein MMC33_010818 [Icmadophila ericetorum]|nr:hypothetical protein [Icmadophila ericetorum]